MQGRQTTDLEALSMIANRAWDQHDHSGPAPGFG
jgi:hypothetical protein